jgi:hypothetical protein
VPDGSRQDPATDFSRVASPEITDETVPSGDDLAQEIAIVR